ncbi:MAG: hypothetical protein AAF845_06430 [Bacteroidota bacterium]
MRLLLCAALALAALPALAQDDPEADDREVEIEIEADDLDDGPMRFRIERDGDDGHVIFHRGDDGEENVFRFRTPSPGDVAQLRGLQMDLDALRDGPFAAFRSGDSPFAVRSFLMGGGVSEETREQMRDLQREAREIAREARRADGAERDAAVRRLDGVLAELFEVRAEARREEAQHLRERARELTAEADEVEDALRERDARREALIDARRAELLGETPLSDW